MRQKKLWFRMSRILGVLAIILMLPAGAVAASKYKVLHRFTGKDGAYSDTGLILDPAGNLYGTTRYGGASGPSGNGTVFELTPNSDGSWTESVLHNFCSRTNCADGDTPSAGLIFDTVGNLYGTTLYGANGYGVVFKLTPNSDGRWTESVLYGFTGGVDGDSPYGGLMFDAAGNLYGATVDGGAYGYGVVFKLTPNSDGRWTESVLYSFTGGADGSNPLAGVIFDTAGSLYGTTQMGGKGYGTVFKLTPNSDGRWTESVLYSFTGGRDRGFPDAGVIFDGAGNLYGTTAGSSSENNGTVFKLTPNSHGSWTESVLYGFTFYRGAVPLDGLTFDAIGNLYGTTAFGDNRSCGPLGCGVVFKMVPQSNGRWAYTVLHAFEGKPAYNPFSGLVLDKAGNLYGTTDGCGGCYGVVFEITP
jgi:uncharacterized repeat protein (TIGR03803 family)